MAKSKAVTAVPVQDWSKLDMNPDPKLLRPELKPYFKRNYKGRGFNILHHPLIVDIMPIPALVNQQYDFKKQAFDAAVSHRRWDKAIGWLERPYRLEYLFTWFADGKVTRRQMRKMLPAWWSDAEPNDKDLGHMVFFEAAKLGGPYLRDGEKLPNLATLPIFRGGHTPGDWKGMAWTLKRETADMFAHRFNLGSMGYIFTGMCQRKDVMAYITGRSEAEVVIDPRKVKRGEVIEVPIARSDKRDETIANLVTSINAEAKDG